MSSETKSRAGRTAEQVVNEWRESGSQDWGQLVSAINYWAVTDMCPALESSSSADTGGREAWQSEDALVDARERGYDDACSVFMAFVTQDAEADYRKWCELNPSADLRSAWIAGRANEAASQGVSLTKANVAGYEKGFKAAQEYETPAVPKPFSCITLRDCIEGADTGTTGAEGLERPLAKLAEEWVSEDANPGASAEYEQGWADARSLCADQLGAAFREIAATQRAPVTPRYWNYEALPCAKCKDIHDGPCAAPVTTPGRDEIDYEVFAKEIAQIPVDIHGIRWSSKTRSTSIKHDHAAIVEVLKRVALAAAKEPRG